jgi:paraquat-inducible protein B
MSKKANPTAIGMFIIVGVALGVLGLILFSSSRWFSRTREVIAYFSDSLNGLNEGAPVKYRGVTIGSVKKVMINFNQATNDFAMPVIIELQENLIGDRLGEKAELLSDSSFDLRIKQGLRGSLQAESLVTGVLYIEIHPTENAPPPIYHQIEKRYPELPTVPTGIQVLLANLSTLDIKGLGDKLTALISRIDSTVAEIKMAEISQSITNLLGSANGVVRSADLSNALVSVHTTLDQYRLLGLKLNNRVDPLVDNVTNTLAEASLAIAQLRGTAENLRGMFALESPLRNGLDQALQQLADAAQSVTSLVEFLKQNPNALIVGREIIPKKP